MAMATNPVVQSGIEAATERHGRIFAAYIVALVVTALVVTLFTWLVWDSGNKVQDALQTEANARIGEANAKADQAKEQTAKIEKENIVLRSDLNTEMGKVAGLQKDAANAKAAQQKVEIELAKQQELAATAERNLLQFKEQMKDRTISNGQADAMVAKLDEMFKKGFPRGKVLIKWATSTPDAWPLVLRLKEILKTAGWTDVSDVAALAMTGEGFFIGMRDRRNPPKCEAAIWTAFNASGIPFTGYDDPDAPLDGVSIVIGQKPPLH
ncbi:MAG: hypothetical protein WBQ76_11380 [Candidatus Korobacteraceae bacterium]